MADTAIKPRVKRAQASITPFAYVDLFRASPTDRIHIIKSGVSATKAKRLSMDLHVDQNVLFGALNLKIATVNRKAAKNETLSIEDGERVVGVAKLVGQLKAMVEESGEPNGFDAAGWLSQWLRQPLIALGGAKPLDLLDTMEGQQVVSTALAQIQSGAYA